MELHSKKRFGKVNITDIAIKKVPHIRYKSLTDCQNITMRHMAQMALLISQQNNNSNEVALTTSLHSDDMIQDAAIVIGDEHGVNICSETKSNHLIVSARDVSVVIIHNHPSTQALSIEDIGFFLYYTTVKLLAVVTNQGSVHYIMKDTDYDFKAAEKLRQDCVEDLTAGSSPKEYYEAALDFLAHCSEAGLYYR